MASLTVTYLLWLCSGWLGLHHLYLCRPYHAFVWFSSLGGCLGIGWFRDMWRIPSYVSQCNADKVYRTRLLHRMAASPSPDCSLFRFGGMFIMGYIFSAILCGLCPNFTDEMVETNSVWYHFCHMLCIVCGLIGSSVGVYLVANIGEMQCHFAYPAIGSLVSIPWLLGTPVNITMATVLAALVSWWFGLEWRPLNHKDKKQGCLVIFIFIMVVATWTGMVGYNIYFNVTVSIDGGGRIPVKEAMANFFASPAWQRTKDSFHHLYVTYRTHGWSRLYRDGTDVLDFSGETSAFEVLNLDKGASQEMITKQCRQLSRKFHPDRHRTAAEKEMAEAQFMRVQQACNTLSRRRFRRNLHNKFSED